MTDKGLSHTINEYLKTRRNHAETHVLNKFKEYIKQTKHAGGDTYIKEIKREDFDRFIIWLKDEHGVSAAALKDYKRRLKGFQEYIELSEVKARKNRNPENDESPQCHELRKKLAENQELLITFGKTIEELTEKNKEQDRIIETLKPKGMEINRLDAEIANRKKILACQDILINPQPKQMVKLPDVLEKLEKTLSLLESTTEPLMNLKLDSVEYGKNALKSMEIKQQNHEVANYII